MRVTFACINEECRGGFYNEFYEFEVDYEFGDIVTCPFCKKKYKTDYEYGFGACDFWLTEEFI